MNLGIHYYKGEGVVQDHTQAVRLYRLAAQQGLLEAQYNLAFMLSMGEGCDKSPVQAVQWMCRAAQLGYAAAQTELARWYILGDCGLPTNYKEAMRLAMLGAEAGNAIAMNHVGVLFHNGWGVAKDLDEASEWYRQAATLGSKAAKNNLRNLSSVRELRLGPL